MSEGRPIGSDKRNGSGDLCSGLAEALRHPVRRQVFLGPLVGDFETAERLRLELIAEDLDWGESGSVVELAGDPEVLDRVFVCLRETPSSPNPILERERIEIQEREDRNRLVLETCDLVLTGSAQLASGCN